VDWLCLPHLESPSVFGRLLDKNQGGYFSLHPAGNFKSRQTYIDRTNVLETDFKTPSAECRLTDFMPPFKKRAVWHKHQTLFRRLKCLKGKETFKLEFDPKFHYGTKSHNITINDFGLVAESGKEKIFLDFPQKLTLETAKPTPSLI